VQTLTTISDIPAPGYTDCGRRGRTVCTQHAVVLETNAGREEVALRSWTYVSRRWDMKQRSRRTAACRTDSLVNRRCHSPVVTGPKRRSATGFVRDRRSTDKCCHGVIRVQVNAEVPHWSGCRNVIVLVSSVDKMKTNIKQNLEDRRSQWSSGLVREGPGSNRAADKSLCFHENHCDTQLWAQAAHWLQCLSRLSLPPSEGR